MSGKKLKICLKSKISNQITRKTSPKKVKNSDLLNAKNFMGADFYANFY